MTSRTDDKLMQLYEVLKMKGASKPGFSGLSDEERRDYMRQKKRESRDRVRAASEHGSVAVNADTIRVALADAAIAVLATDGPGAEEIRRVLAAIFHGRAGVPLTVSHQAQTGRLKPKLLKP